jgi:kynurenine formamidase
MSLTFVSPNSVAKSENAAASLWKIQKVLASKKYVDLPKPKGGSGFPARVFAILP